MDHRIRSAIGMESSHQMSGEIGVDETFGGRLARIAGAEGSTRVLIMGLLQRDADVQTQVILNRK